MRRILLLITDLEIGGTPTVVRDLAIRLNRAGGAIVEVACLSARGPVAGPLRDAGVTVHALDARGSRDMARTVRRLVVLTRERRFDTVFSFLVHANVVASIASRFARDVRFVQSIQTTQPRPRWHWWAQRVVAGAADVVVVPSESVARAAREWAGVAGEKVLVIPNAIDPHEYAPAAVPTPGGPVRVGFIGRLDPIKRVPLLVAALAKLDSRYHLDVYGDGPARRAIEVKIDELDLRARVTLHGTVARPHEALARLDVLALPSLAEGFGLVLIEAMAAGVPVVAAHAPGIRDVVRDGETGLLVDPTDAAAFAAALVAANAPMRDRLVENGLHDVRAKYAWASVLPQYQKLLGIS